METITQMHHENGVLESNIRFYSMEINFLLKIITREYGIMGTPQKTKVLEVFTREFEIYEKRLTSLSDKIKNHEKDIAQEYKGNHIDVKQEVSNEVQLMSECSAIIRDLTTVKESLYDYLENLHLQK